MSVFAMEYKQLVGLRAYPTTNNGRSNMYIHIFFYLHNMLTKKQNLKMVSRKSVKNLWCLNLYLIEVI